MESKRVDFYFTFLVGFGIAYGTLFPLPEFPINQNNDKLTHIISFLILVFPISFLRQDKIIKVIFFSMIFGIGIEIIQPFVNRYGDINDVIANSIGILIGTILAKIFFKKITRGSFLF